MLKDDGALWVIGSYHNIYRVGAILQDLGYWILNDVIWIKTNPMPNFRGVRFANAHETLIWASKSPGARYTFNHHAMKGFNNGKQMRSDWEIPLCTGGERLKINGTKVHPTQKPEALLYRVILSSSNPGDVILDPFFGSGTTGAVAKKLHRQWIGIKQESRYIQAAQQRIAAIMPEPYDDLIFDVRDKKRLAPRVPFTRLLDEGLLQPGQKLFFRGERDVSAKLKPDGMLNWNGKDGSIHQIARQLVGGSPSNGWDLWFYENGKGELQKIDAFRDIIRSGDQAKKDQ